MTKISITFLSLLAFTACKKTEDKTKTADTKVTESKPDTKAEPSAAPPSSDGKCEGGAFYQPVGKFCIKLPKVNGKADGGPGRDLGNNRQGFSWVGGDTGADFSISVEVWPMSEHYADNLQRVAQPPYEGKLGEQGKLGDAGGWASGDSGPPPAGKNQRRWIKSMTKNDKMQMQCEVTRASGPGAPSEAEVFEACKSIAFAK